MAPSLQLGEYKPMKHESMKHGAVVTKTAFAALRLCPRGTVSRLCRRGMPVQPDGTVDREGWVRSWSDFELLCIHEAGHTGAAAAIGLYPQWVAVGKADEVQGGGWDRQHALVLRL